MAYMHRGNSAGEYVRKVCRSICDSDGKYVIGCLMRGALMHVREIQQFNLSLFRLPGSNSRACIQMRDNDPHCSDKSLTRAEGVLHGTSCEQINYSLSATMKHHLQLLM